MPDRERSMQLRVGVFVLGLLILFVVFVLTIGSQSRIFERRYALHAFFGSIEGLNEGAPVRLAGVSVGTVSAIRFDKDLAGKKIKVTVSLDSRVRDRIREDSIASIATIGLVGDKVLELTVGSPDKQVVPPGGILASVDPPDYAKLLEKGNQIVDNVVKISDSLSQLLGGGGGAASRQDLAASISSVRRITEKIERGDGLLPALLHDPKSRELLNELQLAARGLNSLLAKFEERKGLAHALFADPRADKIVADLEEASRNLNLVSTRLARGEGTLGALIDDPTLYEDLSSLLRGANRSLILRTLIQSSRKEGAYAEPR
jgi:phospholipid/cholesterol/gamma-HCH transport system substrate-binding protein